MEEQEINLSFEEIMEHNRDPYNFKEIKDHTFCKNIRNPFCGDSYKLFIKLDKSHKKIIDVSFTGVGCAISKASFSLFTEHLKNLPIEEAKKLQKQDIFNLLSIPVSPPRHKCALLPLKAFKEIQEESKRKEIFNYAIGTDSKREEQFKNCYKQNFVKKAALMSDAHTGYDAPIGSVFITEDVIVPKWIGNDIGCGVLAVRITQASNIKPHLIRVFKRVKGRIPMGRSINEIKLISKKQREEFKKILEELKNNVKKTHLLQFIKNQSLSDIGSLGSGNHFLELGMSNSPNEIWVIVHSGSRRVGQKITKHFSNEDQHLKSTSKIGREYLSYHNFAVKFAELNRYEMAQNIIKIIQETSKEKTKSEIWCDTPHNFIELKDKYFIHRKGSTPAKKQERGIIPANMRDGCFLTEGLGNKNFLESSSHGAGRKLSRTLAKKNLSLTNLEKQMIGVIGKINLSIIDESPEAYKDIQEVLEKQKASTKVISHIRPLINWKAA